MRLVDPVGLAGLGIDSGLRDVQLSKQEIATLRNAARIMHALRALIETVSGEDAGIDVALAAYTVGDLAESGKVKL